MKDEEIYSEVAKFFDIKELVSPLVHKIHGERAWKFLCPRALETLLIIRINIDKSITVNDWAWGGKFTQRGLRSNLGYIFLKMFKRGKLYLSAHVLGRAFDFDVKGMTAIEVRQWIVDNEKLFPHKLRLEWKMKGKEIRWVHLDLIWEKKNPHIYKFNV